MELRHLRYFVAAAEELNITRAAQRLHVSQPPLSRQIHDLEEEIGTPLFDRNKKKLQLTSAGEYFLREAKAILSQARHAASTAKATSIGQAGQITISILSPLGGMFLPRVISSFRKRFPVVEIDVVEMSPRKQLEALLDNQIDLAVVARAEVESINEVAFETFTKVRLLLALAPMHRLARLQRVPLTALKEERFIALKRSAAPGLHEWLLRLCRSAGFEPKVVRQSDRPQSILDLVAGEVGVAILPEHFQRYKVDVVWRPLIPKVLAVPLCIVWRQNDRSPAIHTLRKLIRQHFRSRSSGEDARRSGAPE
jgi:DNA-binding transcriptional LysR family regulator